MLGPIPLSVLDVAPVAGERSHASAVAGAIELARAADECGYVRFWLAEHHGMPGIASSAPAVLAAAVGAATSRIRVGSGGVMLPNHPPLVVAEQFGTLTALHPGRIDLGIGRAPGTDPVTAMALRRDTGALSADDFPRQLVELMSFFRGNFREGHPLRAVRAVPGLGDEPLIWLLGSSDYSAQVAGLLGLPFAYAHHFAGGSTEAALELYRSVFRPSDRLDRPYSMIAVQTVVGDSDEHAKWLAGPSGLSMVRLRQGRPSTLPSPEEAAAHEWTTAERATVDRRWERQAIGSAGTVAQRLEALVAATGVDELMITSSLYDNADRIRTLRAVRALVGEAVPGLTQRGGSDTS